MASSKLPLEWISVPDNLIGLSTKFEKLHCNLRPDQRRSAEDTEELRHSTTYFDGLFIQLRLRKFLRSLEGQTLRLAIHFQGYSKSSGVGTMVVVATPREISDEYFRLDFERNARIDSIYGCPNFWAGFILALCPVSDKTEIGAAGDLDAKFFIRLVERAHKSQSVAA